MARVSFLIFGALVFSNVFGYTQNNSTYPLKPNLDYPEVFLSQYLQIESISGNERDAGEFFAYSCRLAGLHVRVFTHERDSYNFAASLFPLNSAKPNVIFLTHIDVVPAANHNDWLHDPFGGAIAEGYVWGRGAIDNKGAGVMQFFALKHFVELARHNDLPYNVTLLAVSNEELMGGLGAGIIVNQFIDELNPVAVFGEGGAGMRGIINAMPRKVVFGIETAQKRSLWFNLKSTGSSAGHGSVPAARYPAKEIIRASNAILKLKPEIIVTSVVRKMLKGLSVHETGIRRLALRNMKLISPLIAPYLRNDEMTASILTNTIMLTSITSDATAQNQVAQALKASFDARLLPGVDATLFLKEIEFAIKPFEVELEIVSKPAESPSSKENSYYFHFKDALQEVYPDAHVIPILFPAVNDNWFFRSAGIPTFGITPVIFTRELIHTIHNANERMPIDALYQGIDVFKAFIRRIID